MMLRLLCVICALSYEQASSFKLQEYYNYDESTQKLTEVLSNEINTEALGTVTASQHVPATDDLPLPEVHPTRSAPTFTAAETINIAGEVSKLFSGRDILVSHHQSAEDDIAVEAAAPAAHLATTPGSGHDLGTVNVADEVRKMFSARVELRTEPAALRQATDDVSFDPAITHNEHFTPLFTHLTEKTTCTDENGYVTECELRRFGFAQLESLKHVTVLFTTTTTPPKRICVHNHHHHVEVNCGYTQHTVCVDGYRYKPFKLLYEFKYGNNHYFGRIVKCPTTSPVAYRICVNNRNTRFNVPCPKNASEMQYQSTVCVENYERVMWNSLTDHLFGTRFTGKILVCPTTQPTTPTTTCRQTPYPLFDLDALLNIIANITYDYETNIMNNLTYSINETLRNMTIPTCPPFTTTEEPERQHNLTGIILGKCFVCGMDEEGIPRNSRCSDAFAGDFLPLAYVDPSSRGELARYRKYCKFKDIPGWLINATEQRAMYGRWTGGCAVRWVDISSVYTQRTCRNIRHAAMGKHFVSKRMAKLEMALQEVKDGCIASPMAVLVPFSRGISLYARFHACVCSTSWCNAALDMRLTFCHTVLLVLTVSTALRWLRIY